MRMIDLEEDLDSFRNLIYDLFEVIEILNFISSLQDHRLKTSKMYIIFFNFSFHLIAGLEALGLFIMDSKRSL